MLAVYDITVPTNKPFVVAGQAGTYIYYLNGSAGGADATLLVRPGNKSVRIPLKPGQAYRLSNSESEIDTWYLENSAGAAIITGQVLVGDGGLEDNRITGSVEVIDGGRTRTLLNQAFFGANSVAPVAGQYGLLQIFNPVSNTKRLIVKGYDVGAPASISYGIFLWNAALTTLNGQALSKLGGGASSAAETRSQTTAALFGANLTVGYLSANVTNTRIFAEPIVLPPGYGLCINAGVVNTSLNCDFEFIEESNT